MLGKNYVRTEKTLLSFVFCGSPIHLCCVTTFGGFRGKPPNPTNLAVETPPGFGGSNGWFDCEKQTTKSRVPEIQRCLKGVIVGPWDPKDRVGPGPPGTHAWPEIYGLGQWVCSDHYLRNINGMTLPES